MTHEAPRGRQLHLFLYVASAYIALHGVGLPNVLDQEGEAGGRVFLFCWELGCYRQL